MILVTVWLVVGLAFGWPRARAAYRETIDLNKGIEEKGPHSIRLEATMEATIELVKWMLLGFLSAISYVAWLLLPTIIENNKKSAKPNSVEAVFFSVVIFISGALALEKQDTKTWH